MYYALVKSPITAGKIFKEHLSEKLLNDGFNPEMVIDFSKIFIISESLSFTKEYLKENDAQQPYITFFGLSEAFG